MFKLFPLVSEHAIRIINYSKNEKNAILNSIENSLESPSEKLIIDKFPEKKTTLQVRGSRSKYNSKIITNCHTIIIT